MISASVIEGPATSIEEPEHVFNALKFEDESQFWLLQDFCATATEYCEGRLGYKLCEQTLEGVCSSFFCEKIELPYTALLSVESVEYYDAENALQTLDPAAYSVIKHKSPGYIRLNPGYSWPATYQRDDAVRVTYKAGMEASKIPQRAKTALMMLVADHFDNQSAQQVERLHENPAVERLLGQMARPVI